MNPSKTVVLASNNAGKCKEFQQLLAEHALNVRPQGEFEVPEADETGLSFVENAILKARNAAHHAGCPALADDSGLAVDALGGKPGIYSARFAGNAASDADNNRYLLELLQNVDEADRRARFHCLLVFMRHATDPTPLICQGSWEGRILTAPRGDNGFGYDPLFFVPEHQCSSAELPPAVKNQISHRARAMQLLLQRLPSLL